MYKIQLLSCFADTVYYAFTRQQQEQLVPDLRHRGVTASSSVHFDVVHCVFSESVWSTSVVSGHRHAAAAAANTANSCPFKLTVIISETELQWQIYWMSATTCASCKSRWRR